MKSYKCPPRFLCLLMFRLLLSTLGALAFTQAESNPPQDSIENTNSTYELPDAAPYNLMFPQSTPGHVHYPDNPNNIEFVSIPICAVHKRARVTYKEGSDKEVTGFDLYLRGTTLSMSPAEYGEGVDEETKIVLNLPISPNHWSSTDINHTYVEKKFTRREKFMQNKHTDIYLRFRRPGGAIFKKTKALVDDLNKNRTAISGIETVNRLLAITNNPEIETISDAFKEGAASSIYLDLEYDTLQVTDYSHSDIREGLIIMMIFFLLLTLILCPISICGLLVPAPQTTVISDILCLIGVGICLLLVQILVRQRSIKVF